MRIVYNSNMEKWSFWIDCGGTFTDFVAISDSNEYKVHKLLSHSPHYKSAVVEGIKQVLGHDDYSKSIKEIRLGTTVATNAFLERNGVPCALITTLGHKDVLEIRQQNRPELFDLDIKKIPPLYDYVTSIQGRMNKQGEVIEKLDLEIAKFELQRILDLDIKSIAISLMHATINNMHEVQLGELAYSMGFEYISLSHKVSSIPKYIARTETTVMDAYLSPYLSQYTQDLEQQLGINNILYMQSNGGLCKSNELQGYNALLSGPAGGLIGAVEMARKVGHKKIITFDMGGTSTDVAIYNHELSIDNEPNFYGVKVLSPMVDIHTVAAGGGSILKYDKGRLMVGPESAKAFPGPACYRNGGPLTITDANLFLNRIDPQMFPKVFGKKQSEPLDLDVVKNKFQILSNESGISPKDLAEGFLKIAVETMSRAIRKISIEKGYDPQEFTLVSFGGAGGQLALNVAESLKIKNVYIHPMSSVLSAYGMGLADHSITLNNHYAFGHEKLIDQAKEKLGENLSFQKYFLINAPGSDHIQQINANNIHEANKKFKQLYKEIFNSILCEVPECKTITLKATVVNNLSYPSLHSKAPKIITGPNIINENNTSIIVEDGWTAYLKEDGSWIIKASQANKINNKNNDQIDLEIFYQRFQFIAEQMGFTLQKMAKSVNIKERNDFSCALFNQKGELIANAPHIPVHLGSMGDAVKAVSRLLNIQPRQSFICNDPSLGGTHLPDITVITPLFIDNHIFMWLASRGHHADIGGITPGSMPGNSTVLDEEGVVIAPVCFAHNNKIDEGLIRSILLSSKHPVRNIEANLHDIKAKLIANINGLNELKSFIAEKTHERTSLMVEKLLHYSDVKMKTLLSPYVGMKAKKIVASDRIIKLEVCKKNNKYVFDFTGTSPELKTNFNTPIPVVKASVLFALRSLIVENIPLNDGLMRSVELIIPKASMLNPSAGKAVVAGNVETSQVICDLIFETLKIKANSQGTMNNISFGNNHYQYYETLAGGSGATQNSDGADAVQVNMTNSLLTDPETFELRFPVLLEMMSIRQGSGGHGDKSGGHGLYRKIKFLERMHVSILSQFRDRSPLGIEGGKSAQRGINQKDTGAELINLPENISLDFSLGESLLISTPGGGGYGTPKKVYRNLVFGFGSNMDLQQIKQRCPSVKLVTRAHVKNVELRYTRFSTERQGGVADMFLAPGHNVFGLLIDIDDEDLKNLDRIECADLGYQRIHVEAYDDNNNMYKAYAYDVIDKKPDIAPTKIYEWLVYSGAYYLNLSKKYLAHIKKFRKENE